MDDGAVPLDPYCPRECLEDPWAELRRWEANGFWWPYCTLCDAWSDTNHIASKTHKKRLRYYKPPVVHHQRSFHPSSPVASAPAQRGFAPAAAAVVPMDVAAPPPPSPPSSKDIFEQGLPWRLFDFQHIESV